MSERIFARTLWRRQCRCDIYTHFIISRRSLSRHSFAPNAAPEARPKAARVRRRFMGVPNCFQRSPKPFSNALDTSISAPTPRPEPIPPYSAGFRNLPASDGFFGAGPGTGDGCFFFVFLTAAIFVTSFRHAATATEESVNVLV